MLKKTLIAAATVAMTGLAGCEVYAPAPAIYTPGLVVAPAPLYIGGYYPRHYGYYGYRGYGYRGYYGGYRGHWR